MCVRVLPFLTSAHFFFSTELWAQSDVSAGLGQEGEWHSRKTSLVPGLKKRVSNPGTKLVAFYASILAYSLDVLCSFVVC